MINVYPNMPAGILHFFSYDRTPPDPEPAGTNFRAHERRKTNFKNDTAFNFRNFQVSIDTVAINLVFDDNILRLIEVVFSIHKEMIRQKTNCGSFLILE